MSYDMFHCYNIVNLIENVDTKKYLELGVADCNNFNNTKCNNKFSVDLNGKANFTMTTDQFFSNWSKDEKVDIIYIDANHDYDYVLRDFNNSLDHCNDWIFLHDMIPPSLSYTDSRGCSDCYKLLYYMLKEKNFNMWTMDHPMYMGLTFIKMPAEKLTPSDDYKNLTYDEFINFINSHHKRISAEQAKIILNM